MLKNRKGSCLGTFLTIVLVIVIICAILGGLIYFAIRSPEGFAGKAVETIMAPFASKEIRASMDSTEEFFNEYIKLAKTLDDKNSAEIKTKMDDYMEKYQKAMNDLNAIDKNSVSWFSRLYLGIRLVRMSTRASKELQEIGKT